MLLFFCYCMKKKVINNFKNVIFCCNTSVAAIVSPSGRGSRVMAVLSRPLPRLTRWGRSAWNFSPFPVSIRSSGVLCKKKKNYKLSILSFSFVFDGKCKTCKEFLFKKNTLFYFRTIYCCNCSVYGSLTVKRTLNGTECFYNVVNY